MTIEYFNKLDDEQKARLIIEAKKITEKIDGEANYQLFCVGNFYVEKRACLEGKSKTSFYTYSLKELPADYVGEILAMPVVTLNSPATRKNIVRYLYRKTGAAF